MYYLCYGSYWYNSINYYSYKFKSLVGHEYMTNLHGGGCHDLPSVVICHFVFFMLWLASVPTELLHICGFMNLHPKCIG